MSARAILLTPQGLAELAEQIGLDEVSQVTVGAPQFVAFEFTPATPLEEIERTVDGWRRAVEGSALANARPVVFCGGMRVTLIGDKGQVISQLGSL